MRYMGLLKGNQQSENFVPTPDDFARMGQYIDQAMKAGWLIATDGLQSSSKASRIQVADGKRTVTDGPFTEAKELIASYAILEVGSKDEAIERTTEFLNLIGGGEIDLYRIYEPSDFAQERRAAMALLTRPKAGYAPANGLRMYYEIHGTGEPLILLHGGFGSTGMFGEVRSLLAASHQVIAVDLQGHGRTADIDRPLRFEDMADDVAALLAFLGIAQADFMGYSLGGGTALRVSLQHPELVRKLVLVSTPFGRDGWYPEILEAMDQMGPAAAEAMKPSPIYQTYAEIAPHPEHWPALVTKVGDLLRSPYDWSKEIAAIRAHTLLVFGDADSIRLAHAVRFFELLGGGQKDGGWDGSGMSDARLAIIPGTSHYDIFSAPALGSTVMPFLS